MKVAGIIAEYNPFHTGHLYHLQKTKELTGADYVIAVMSGNYVERGAPAVADYETRVKMALTCGVDAVILLPLYFSLGSAELFANGAVTILSSLGVVDYLSFGSESGELAPLLSLSSLLSHETAEYKALLQDFLRHGESYPLARFHAVSHICPSLADYLNEPNNILAIEYLRALQKQNSLIIPVTMKRKGDSYHTQTLSTGTDYPSAAAIRSKLMTSFVTAPVADFDCLTCLSSFLPPGADVIFSEAFGKRMPVCVDDFSSVMYYRLLQETKDTLPSYLDISVDLSNRILSERKNYTSFSEFVTLLSHKNIVQTRISRALFHVLLNIPSDISLYLRQDACYAKLLGFRREAAPLIKAIKDNTRIPLITKGAHAKKLLSPPAYTHFTADLDASSLYYQIVKQKFDTVILPDNAHSVIISDI